MKSKKSASNRTIAVIGLGYVGLPLALLAERKGFRVIGLDVNEARVKSVNARKAPFRDKEIARNLAAAKNLAATTDFSALSATSIILICVPTPVHGNSLPDLRPVISACLNLSPYLQPGQLIILESTVNPGVCEEVVIPTIEKATRLRAGKDFYVAHCPERINPGDTTWNVENIPRVVGSQESVGLKKALNFYKKIVSAPITPMGSLKEAEAVKIVENSFRDVNIAFVNELAMSFDRLGIDVVRVIKGASTKPFAFLAHYPGCGVGGHCIPVDPYYLIHYARRNGFSHRFLSLARKINQNMPSYTVELLIRGLKARGQKISGSRVALLGLAYKPDIEDDRESPAHEILAELKSRGLKTAVFDPYARGSTVKNLREALRGAKGAIIATAHNEFKRISPENLAKAGVRVVIDGRNCLDKEEFANSGIYYRGIGRS